MLFRSEQTGLAQTKYENSNPSDSRTSGQRNRLAAATSLTDSHAPSHSDLTVNRGINPQTLGEHFHTKKRIRPEPLPLDSGGRSTPIQDKLKQPWRAPSQQNHLAPASFQVVDSDQALPQGATEFLGKLAEDFKSKLENSGLEPDSPAYKTLWETEAFLNDIRFKTSYGDSVWLQHHNSSQNTNLLN